MTAKETKVTATNKLRKTIKEGAALDVEILLAHALGISREEMLTHDERRTPAFALRRFNALVARRAKHEPIAYLTGHKEFFGLTFEVNRHTLIPRPETELLVEETLGIINSRFQQPKSKEITERQRSNPKMVVYDVGTGSGAIAVAVAKNAPDAMVIAMDISAAAIKMARRNAAANDVADRIIFLRSDLLHNKLRPQFIVGSIIIANLPYLPTKVWQKCAPEVKKFEPRTALDGGKDGLKYYDKLFHQVAGLGIKPTMICEIDPSQKKSFPALVHKHFPEARIKITNDLAGRPRVAMVEHGSWQI